MSLLDKFRGFLVLGETMFFFGLLGWVYGVVIQITHPSWLAVKLTHLTPWLRVDVFAIASFFISVVGFYIWRYFKIS